jgi:plasmid maintenance system killer protein
MKKMLFDRMNAVYRIKSRYDKVSLDGGDHYSSVFNEKWHINAQLNKEQDLYVFILNRSETLLNGKPPEKLMDKIMLETGNSYYPVHLLVSPQLIIMDIINFDGIIEKWKKCALDLQERMSSPELERYLRFSENNLAGSRKFISSLYRNAFYKLYFRDIFTSTTDDEVRLIRWDNFPEREMNQSYLYQVKPSGENEIRLSGEIMKIVPEHNGTYDSTYETGTFGEILRITCHIETEWEGSRYTKHLQIEAEAVNTQ